MRFVTGQNLVVDGGLTSQLAAYASEEARRKMPADLGEVSARIEAHRARRGAAPLATNPPPEGSAT